MKSIILNSMSNDMTYDQTPEKPMICNFIFKIIPQHRNRTLNRLNTHVRVCYRVFKLSSDR